MEFTKLCQVGMIVKEYSLKFTKLSKYAPTLVKNSRDKMNQFMMGFSSFVEKEFPK